MHQNPRACCGPEDEVTAVNRAAVLIGARLPLGVDARRDQTGAAPEAWYVLEQHSETLDTPGHGTTQILRDVSITIDFLGVCRHVS